MLQIGLIRGLFLLLVIGFNPFAFASEPLPLSNGDVLSVPAWYANFWIHSDQLSNQEVVLSDRVNWQPVEFATITAGPQQDPVWFRIPVVNATPLTLQRLLEVRWLSIKSIQLYVKRENSVDHQQFGIDDEGVFTAPHGSSFVFPLQLAPGEQVELFFQVNTNYFTFLPLFVWDETAYRASRVEIHNWYLLGFGALLALLFYNLSLSIFVRDRAYLFYCVYVASIIVYELAFNGMGNAYLWGSSAWMHEHALAIGIYFSFLTGSLFIRVFLNIGAYSIWLRRVVDFSIVYWLVAIGMLFIKGDFFQSSIYMSLVCCLFALGASLYLWHCGNVLAKYYFFAWVTLLFFTVGMLLMITGILPHHPLTEHGQMIGFVTEMLLLSFALAARINMERNAREQAQQQVLELEKQNIVLLEKRVEERTQELKQTMDRLSDANDELARLSVTDALTGVANRRHFDTVLEREVQRTERNDQPLSLMLIDIDHFKQLNDRYGHLAGDECLKNFAALLESLVTRKTDLVARYGGEEFAVILPDTHLDAASALAETVRAAVQNMAIVYKSQKLLMTVSIGVVGTGSGDHKRIVDLIAAADKALYSAKHTGRNCCVVAESR